MTYKEALEHARLNRDLPISPVDYAADPRIKASLEHAAQSAVNDGFGMHANHIVSQINRLDALVAATPAATPLGIDLAPHAETQVLPNETGVDIGSADLAAGPPAETSPVEAAAIEAVREAGIDIIAAGLQEPQDASEVSDASQPPVDLSEATSASEQASTAALLAGESDGGPDEGPYVKPETVTAPKATRKK